MMNNIETPWCNIVWCQRDWVAMSHLPTQREFAMAVEQRDKRYLKVLERLDKDFTDAFCEYLDAMSVCQQCCHSCSTSSEWVATCVGRQTRERTIRDRTSLERVLGTQSEIDRQYFTLLRLMFPRNRQSACAERDDLTQGIVLTHFKNKEALFTEIAWRVLGGCSSRYEAPAELPKNFVKKQLTRWNDD